MVPLWFYPFAVACGLYGRAAGGVNATPFPARLDHDDLKYQAYSSAAHGFVYMGLFYKPCPAGCLVKVS